MNKKMIYLACLSALSIMVSGCKTEPESPKGEYSIAISSDFSTEIEPPPEPPKESYQETNLDQTVSNVNVAPDAFVQVIGSFDDALQTIEAGWKASGAFSNPASAASWAFLPDNQIENESEPTAFVGLHGVSTCEINENAEGCDAPTGTLLSPFFKVDSARPYLRLLLSGGNAEASNDVGIRVLNESGNEITRLNPGNCGGAWNKGNNDWQTIDLSANVGEYVQVEMYDNESQGCGFIAFDHLHMSAFESLVTDYSEADVDQSLLNVSVSNDSFTQVIGSFDDALAMLESGWSATGAFASPASATSWAFLPDNNMQGEDAKAAVVGLHAASTCEINENSEGCDAPTGTLTSPLFLVNEARPILNMLLSGGNAEGSNDVGMKILAADGSEIASYNPGTCGDAHIKGDHNWISHDLTDYIGQNVRVEIYDNEEAGCGFIAFDHLHMSSTAGPVNDYKEINPDQSVANVTLADDSFAQVIASFDNPTAMIANGWQATGDFIPAEGTSGWTFLPDNHSGDNGQQNAQVIGLSAGSTCEINDNEKGCDAPTGTLTSPEFVVNAERPYLNVNLGGGDAGKAVGLKVLNANGEEIAITQPQTCNQAWLGAGGVVDTNWHTLDLSDYVGQSVQVQLFDNESGGCGFLAFDHIHMSATQLAQ